MNRLPAWTWVLAAVTVLVVVGYRGVLRAEYYKGLADAAAEESARQSELITESQARTDSLSAGLEELEILAHEHAVEDSIRRGEIARVRTRARSLSDSLSLELASRLDSVQAHQLKELEASHQVEVRALTDAVELETEGRRIEALRADRANNLVIQLQVQMAQMEQRDSTRLVEIEALRQATGGLSLSVKAGWLTGVGGVVLGYALASVLGR